MIRLPPNSTLTDALFPYTTLFRSSAMGVQNILCLTGDGVQAGDQPGAKPVFDLDCMSLLSSVRTMRDEARFLSCRKRSDEHTSELQSLMRISYAVFCLQKKIHT